MEKYKYNLPFMIIGGVFSLVAVVFIVISAANVVKWNSFKDKAVSVTAEITDIDTHRERRGSKTKTYHDVYIEYDYNGRHYSEELSYYSSGMAVGDKITVLIDPDKPERNMSDPGVIIGIFLVFVFVFGSIGAAFLVHELRMGAYINGLIRDDKYVYAEYTGEEPSNLTVNKVRYNQSVFTYDNGFGITMTFHSHPHSPCEQPYSTGDTVKVYVDMEKNANKHYVSSGKIGF